MKYFAIATATISIIILSIILGRYTVKCEICTPQVEYKYIKIKHDEKEIEIKREVEKKISDIPNATILQLDSIWSEYASRYGKITH